MNENQKAINPAPLECLVSHVPIFWLSYGFGVNSTALAILLVSGKLPQYEPWRVSNV